MKKQSKQFNGASYLRRLVAWMNKRPEALNEHKSVLTLIDEFNKWSEK